MNRIIGLTGVCAVMAALGAAAAVAAHAQTPTLVTLSFKLTINGTAARADGFAVTWGETGLVMCNAPCVGGGHTYIRTMSFPKGVTETFVFARSSGTGGANLSRQQFGRQTVTANQDRAVSAFFDYGSATTVATPSTGSGPSVPLGAAIAGSGVGLVAVALRRRRHQSAA